MARLGRQGLVISKIEKMALNVLNVSFLCYIFFMQIQTVCNFL